MCRGRECVAASPGSCTYCLAVCVNIIQKGTWGDPGCPEQILDQCPEPRAAGAYLASTVNMKIASLFHLHSDEYNKCSVLVQQPVVQGQESGPTVRVSPSLPEAEKEGEGQATPGVTASSLCDHEWRCHGRWGLSMTFTWRRGYSSGLEPAPCPQCYFVGVTDWIAFPHSSYVEVLIPNNPWECDIWRQGL